MKNKFYKDSDNNIYAFADDGSEDSYIKDSYISITEEEADKIISSTNNKTPEEIRANIQPLSRFQAISILELTPYGDSNLLNATDAYFKDLAKDTVENTLAINAWNMANEFRRLSPMILQLQAKFELSDEEVDSLFERGLAFVM